jgi:hypothetical protein
MRASVSFLWHYNPVSQWSKISQGRCEMKSAKTAIRLARASQFLGILSVIIPLIAFFIQWIPREEARLWFLLPLLTTLGGVLFGVPGYLAATFARRDMMSYAMTEPWKSS